MTRKKKPFRPEIHNQADLEAAWRQLMEPLGFGRASMWLMLVDEHDRPIPRLTKIEDCEGPPPPVEEMSGFASMLAHLLDDVGGAAGARWAILRSRPGRGPADEDDLGWAAGIHEACRKARVPLDVIHLATDDALVPVPFDELTGYVRAS